MFWEANIPKFTIEPQKFLKFQETDNLKKKKKKVVIYLFRLM